MNALRRAQLRYSAAEIGWHTKPDDVVTLVDDVENLLAALKQMAALYDGELVLNSIEKPAVERALAAIAKAEGAA